MEKLLSIIVPVYNVQNYLSRCVESLLVQSYKNIEIILVDDGSTDNSGAICDEYAKKDKRIKVIHKENSGQADTRNVGLDVATGELIGFVDSDDYVHIDMYRLLAEAIEANNADITMCKLKKVFDIPMPSNHRLVDALCKEIDKNELYDMWHWVEINVLWNKLFKAEILKDIRLPKGKIYEDEYIKPHIFERCKKLVYVTEQLYFYQKDRQNSTTRKEFYINKMDKLDAIYENIKWFKQNKLKEQLASEMKYYYEFFCDYYSKCININDTYLRTKYLRKYKIQIRKFLLCMLKSKMFSVNEKFWITRLSVTPKLTLKHRDKKLQK